MLFNALHYTATVPRRYLWPFVKFYVLLLAIPILMLTVTAAPARAAGPADTVLDLYPEPAGTTFKVMKLVLQLLGYWRESDPYESILGALFDQIGEIHGRLAA